VVCAGICDEEEEDEELVGEAGWAGQVRATMREATGEHFFRQFGEWCGTVEEKELWDGFCLRVWGRRG
jgi:hypothetical protein